jgi:hypothetical protein
LRAGEDGVPICSYRNDDTEKYKLWFVDWHHVLELCVGSQ